MRPSTSHGGGRAGLREQRRASVPWPLGLALASVGAAPGSAGREKIWHEECANLGAGLVELGPEHCLKGQLGRQVTQSAARQSWSTSLGMSQTQLDTTLMSSPRQPVGATTYCPALDRQGRASARQLRNVATASAESASKVRRVSHCFDYSGLPSRTGTGHCDANKCAGRRCNVVCVRVAEGTVGGTWRCSYKCSTAAG